MTKTEYRKYMRELIKATTTDMRVLSEKAIKCGAIDLESAENNYSLPKTILSAICIKMASEWRPYAKEGKATVKKLGHFL